MTGLGFPRFLDVCVPTLRERDAALTRLSDAGRRLATTCIKQAVLGLPNEAGIEFALRQVGVNQTCGVNGCQCGILSDLLCDEPPLPAHICVKACFTWADGSCPLAGLETQVARPLCAAAGTNVPTSGMHGHLFNILLASIVLCVALINYAQRVDAMWRELRFSTS